jgi:hypothetical protein
VVAPVMHDLVLTGQHVVVDENSWAEKLVQ